MAINPNFRRTAAGLKLGRQLFSGDFNLSPTQISALLRQMGIDVPPAVQVTADAAQILMAGGAIVSDIQKGADILAYAVPTAAILNATADLLSILGIADPKSPGMEVMRLGSETAMVVSSGGMNIIADLSLALDIVFNLAIGSDERPQVTAEVKKDVAKKAQDAANAHMKTVMSEKNAAASQFSAYQTKKISIFEMIANVAKFSPDLFANYFPDISVFVPPVTVTQNFSESKKASYGGVFGLGRETTVITERASISWKTTFLNDLRLAQIFVKKYLNDPIAPYRTLLGMPLSLQIKSGYPIGAVQAKIFDPKFPVFPRVPFETLAALSLFPPYFNFINQNFDLAKVLVNLNLTMKDLGFGELFVTSIQSAAGQKPQYKTYTSPALSINGVDLYSQNEKTYNDYVTTYDEKVAQVRASADLSIKNCVAASERGDIQGVVKYPLGARIIREFGIMPYLAGGNEGPLGYRNIQNFWSCVSLLDRMKKDPFFNRASVSVGNPLSDAESFIPSMDVIEDQHRALQFIIAGRKLNLGALANVASFFKVPVNKIAFNPPQAGKLATVKLL